MERMSDYLFDSDEVTRRLLVWYADEGRDLPWRHTRDPYRIWLSEIMLQQTGVATVIPHYRRFLAAFPTLRDLAAAPVEEVIEQWSGLGYYSRARNLHAAARQVVEDLRGVFPSRLDRLLELPGIGRSTAGAILSIAFDRPAPILDGNVRRVLCRLFAVTEPPRAATTEKRLWQYAGDLTSKKQPHDYAQAIMDLGATICTPRRPDCPRCPLSALCQAKSLGMEGELPVRMPRKAVPKRLQVALLLQADGRCLVRRRPLSGMLAGLWEFPAADLPDGEEPAVCARDLLKTLGFEGELHPAGNVTHAYSHFRVEVLVFCAEVGPQERVAEGESLWADIDQLGCLAIHGAHKKILPLLASPF